MNPDSFEDRLAGAWPVQTQEIVGRVLSETAETAGLIEELRLLRAELAELRRETRDLRFEIQTLNTPNKSVRIAPFAASEPLIRLS